MKKLVCLALSLLVFIVLFGGMEGEVSAQKSFSDISSNYPYADQISFLVNKGIINGYPDNTFRPNEKVTRREAAKMIGSAFNLSGSKRKTVFSDVKATDYASGYIQSAYEAGYLTGYGDGTYRPGGQMTRGEMSYLISKAFNFTASKKYYFVDVNPFSHQYSPINKIANNGVTIGYSDDTYQPKRDMTRAEFALFVARSLEPSFRVTKSQMSPETRIIKADWLNVRKGPNTSYESVGLLKYGTTVSHYFVDGEWAFVKGSGLEGYVHTAYLGSPTPISGKIITVDPGHGDTDPGASANGLVEKEVVLAVSKKLRTYLEQAGAKVVMTREGDTYPSLRKRVEIAETSKSDSFISVHANNFHSDAAHGTETFFNKYAPKAKESEKLATYIQNRLYKAIDTSNRGVKHGDFHVIRENSITAVLVELGFLSNPSDAKKLASDSYRDKAAKAIYLGIMDYYESK